MSRLRRERRGEPGRVGPRGRSREAGRGRGRRGARWGWGGGAQGGRDRRGSSGERRQGALDGRAGGAGANHPARKRIFRGRRYDRYVDVANGPGDLKGEAAGKADVLENAGEVVLAHPVTHKGIPGSKPHGLRVKPVELHGREPAIKGRRRTCPGVAHGRIPVSSQRVRVELHPGIEEKGGNGFYRVLTVEKGILWRNLWKRLGVQRFIPPRGRGSRSQAARCPGVRTRASMDFLVSRARGWRGAEGAKDLLHLDGAEGVGR